MKLLLILWTLAMSWTFLCLARDLQARGFRRSINPFKTDSRTLDV